MENQTIAHPATLAADSQESTTSPHLLRGPSDIGEGSRNKSGKEYPIFWKNPKTNTVFKQDTELSLYYVQVVGYESGSFKHHRGSTFFPTVERLREQLDKLPLEPATADDYITMMKNYFAIDKRVREGFIKSLNNPELMLNYKI